MFKYLLPVSHSSLIIDRTVVISRRSDSSFGNSLVTMVILFISRALTLTFIEVATCK